LDEFKQIFLNKNDNEDLHNKKNIFKNDDINLKNNENFNNKINIKNDLNLSNNSNNINLKNLDENFPSMKEDDEKEDSIEFDEIEFFPLDEEIMIFEDNEDLNFDISQDKNLNKKSNNKKKKVFYSTDKRLNIVLRNSYQSYLNKNNNINVESKELNNCNIKNVDNNRSKSNTSSIYNLEDKNDTNNKVIIPSSYTDAFLSSLKDNSESKKI
jgi:hypothetical protein